MTGFSDIDGAVSGDQGIAHFGDVFREQRRLAAGAALVPLDDRTVIEVAGPERLGWLDSITSQALGRLTAGDST
ncbi:folate-binding protein, partial [Pseudomonas sp. BGM005]|nr:folate-binding protein [Pseudomonas sp. BG5]